MFDECLLGYDFNAIEFICGDNTSCNPKLARLIGDHINQPVPLIGCASHKLNLAVLHHVETSYKVVIDKLTELCRQLRILKMQANSGSTIFPLPSSETTHDGHCSKMR
jgi:hypothetical protein